jgi:Tol biopolymer transport system component
MTPPVLEYVVATCLRKDPEERFQTAHDVKLQLRWVLEGGSQAGVATPVPARRKHRAWLAWGVAGALFAAAVILAYVAYREHSKVPTGVIQSWIEQPEKQVFAFTGDAGGPPTISPDGTRVVYAASDSTGKQHLWIRPLDTLAAQMVAGSDDATFPFWSPDSKKIGFFANGFLKVSDLYGGSPLVLCPAAAGRGGAWSKDDVILFSPNFTAGVYTVSATGGTPTQILDPVGTQFSSYRWPQFMPDGKHFVFLAVQHEKPSDSSLMFASLDDRHPKEVMKTGAAARYASGRLLYLRENALYAQAFDPSSGKVSGELSPIADQVLWDVSVWRGVFDVSDNGELVYERGLALTPTRLAWFDLTGKQLSTVDVSTGFAGLDLTRDGKGLAAQGNPATSELWAYELSRGTRTRVTFDAWAHTFPIWSPDKKWIAYVAVNPAGGSRICRKLADGSGDEEVLYDSAKTKATTDWSPDGKYIVYVEPNGNLQGSGIWALPVEGDHKPFPVLQTPFVNLNARFSPDGRWIAFQSSESDRPEIYVVSFPKPAGKWQVSLEGGMAPQWTNDGSHIYFISTTTNQIMAADVSTKGNNFSVGGVKMKFPLTGSATLVWFAPSPDGKRILAPAPTNEHQPPITLVTNWTAKVKK